MEATTKEGVAGSLPQFLTTAEVMEMCRIRSRSTIHRAVQDGHLKPYGSTRLRRYRADEVMQWFSNPPVHEARTYRQRRADEQARIPGSNLCW